MAMHFAGADLATKGSRQAARWANRLRDFLKTLQDHDLRSKTELVALPLDYCAAKKLRRDWTCSDDGFMLPEWPTEANRPVNVASPCRASG
jgi:hypothetical protein